jgi:fumarate reductase subunit D
MMADKDPRHQEAGSDELIENYRTILNELSLLTTVSVLLFGFLLAKPSIASSDLEEWTYAVAIVMVATATLVFVLPVAYHHLQFPYRDFDKFQQRTHNWVTYGLPVLGTSFYLTLVLSISSIFDEVAILIAGLPLLATLVAFFARKMD